jgi:uncharacterized membrane protein
MPFNTLAMAFTVVVPAPIGMRPVYGLELVVGVVPSVV